MRMAGMGVPRTASRICQTQETEHPFFLSSAWVSHWVTNGSTSLLLSPAAYTVLVALLPPSRGVPVHRGIIPELAPADHR